MNHDTTSDTAAVIVAGPAYKLAQLQRQIDIQLQILDVLAGLWRDLADPDLDRERMGTTPHPSGHLVETD